MTFKIKKWIPQPAINVGVHFPKAVLANFKYGFPGKKLHVIGVTGTDGKTTTVSMIYHILKDAGKKVAMVSTINAVVGEKQYDTGFHVTTPSPHLIQRFLKEALKAGSEYLVLEVTSHSLDQFRVWGIKFDVGVITNVTHEHLDYHKTFENYLLAKAKLIRGAKVVILNYDDPNFNRLCKMAPGRVVSFGLDKKADVNQGNFSLKLKIPGEYNLQNALAAAAVADYMGVARESIKKSLEDFSNLKGRMEEVENGRGIRVVVDFAHTPNGLENALKVLRKETKGRVMAVFGTASERDLKKRPLMGKIAGKLADIIVLTDEDPRFEDRLKIIEEIAEGVRRTDFNVNNLFIEPDREKAIALAISKSKRGDTVGIFGKGHEKSMNYQGIEKSWSDRDAALKGLNAGSNKSA